MTRLIVTISVLWLSSAKAHGINGIVKSITKEVAALKDPIEKTAVYIGFSQCKYVKKMLGVDYDQYQNDPDMSKLTVDFITRDINIEINLTALMGALSKWLKPPDGVLIYLHGFTDDPSKDSYKNISNAFLLQGAGYMVALDASSLIRWFYLRSSTMIRFIGQQLGEALIIMIKAGLNPASIYLVGHSLGAHIASFAGKTVLARTGSRVGRISGLDPAGPCFSDVDLALRLNKNDASYVDVIHTDAGVFGLNEIIGHADYYPNSGSDQPGCFWQTCSHSRAWLLYAESVMNPKGFPAVRCSSWKAFREGILKNCSYIDYSFMGYGSKPGTIGQYYLQTGASPPYALGFNGIHNTDKRELVNSVQDHVKSSKP